jgi:DNA primase
MNGLSFYTKLFGAPKHGLRSLDRQSLPSPLAYLTQRGLVGRRPRGESVAIVCPSHKAGEEAHASMLVSLVDGHFRCMACGVKGGDLIALHRLITGLGFREAVLDLGGRFHE